MADGGAWDSLYPCWRGPPYPGMNSDRIYMQLTEFQHYIKQRGIRFHNDVRLTELELERAEQTLQRRFPATFSWLGLTHGFARASGTSSLDMIVEATLRWRERKIPQHLIVLHDWGDAGIVYLDYAVCTENNDPFIFATSLDNFNRLAEGEDMNGDIDGYTNYALWVVTWDQGA
jgi:hypothetical protein